MENISFFNTRLTTIRNSTDKKLIQAEWNAFDSYISKFKYLKNTWLILKIVSNSVFGEQWSIKTEKLIGNLFLYR